MGLVGRQEINIGRMLVSGRHLVDTLGSDPSYSGNVELRGRTRRIVEYRTRDDVRADVVDRACNPARECRLHRLDGSDSLFTATWIECEVEAR